MAGPLAVFAPLLGHCFVATLSADTVNRHCFTSLYDGAHVRDAHVVLRKGKQVYAGETTYSAEGSRLLFTYFNSLGGAGKGTGERTGANVDFSGTMRGSPDGKALELKLRWTIGETFYEVANPPAPTLRFVRER